MIDIFSSSQYLCFLIKYCNGIKKKTYLHCPMVLAENCVHIQRQIRYLIYFCSANNRKFLRASMCCEPSKHLTAS